VLTHRSVSSDQIQDQKSRKLESCSEFQNHSLISSQNIGLFLREIESFRDKQTEILWQGKRTRFPADLLLRAIDKLNIIDAATSLETLRVPPSNRLEALKNDRVGQHSIRINDQWRVCFRWEAGNAHEVEITDYH
jgi:toxin HigB-1